MTEQHYVYIHMRPDGTPFYVGKGSGKRAWNLVREKNPHHSSVVQKHGAGSIRVRVIYCESEDAALRSEVRHIAELRAQGFRLCNVTDGGNAPKHTQETKVRISAARLGKGFHSDEWKQKARQRMIGNSNATGVKLPYAPRPGAHKPKSAETRARMKAAWVIRKRSERAAT